MKVLFVVTQINNAYKMNSFLYTQACSLRFYNVDVTAIYLTGYRGYKYIKGIQQINKQLALGDYDIVHCHYNYNAWAATFQKEVPVVVSFMGCDILRKWKRISRVINSMINRRVYSKAAYVIYKTEEMAQHHMSKTPYSIIPNGVDTAMFYPCDKHNARALLGLSQSRKYVLFASDPRREEKNFELAKEAVDSLSDLDCEMCVVFKEDQETLNLYYNACDVLLVTSLREGSINTVKEAMACNMNIVSVDVGDVKLHSYNVSNVVIAERNVPSIVEKIRDKLETTTAVTSREYIEHNYSLELAARRIENVYKSVLTKEK